MKLMSWSYRLISLKYFYTFSGKCILPLALGATVLFVIGLIGGLFLAPPDYQQGEGFRIIYVHVPCAVLSLMIYMIMAVAAFVFLVWKIKLADITAKASASLGATFTFLALFTGSLWGKPMWGTWWIWDARLTSELILLFIYFGVIALRSAIPNTKQAAQATSIFILIGAIDIPIIHYSVNWWNTLHQQATILKFAKPSMTTAMLWPLLVMLAAFILYYFAILLAYIRAEILQREAETKWIKDLPKNWEYKYDN